MPDFAYMEHKENMWGDVVEEVAPGMGNMDLSWMIPFWASFTDCVIELDASHTITNVRRKAESGSALAGITGKSFLSIAAEKDRELVADNLDKLKTAAVPYLRFPFLSNIGKYYRWTLIPFYNERVYSGCHGVAVDVTEQTLTEITLNWQSAVMDENRDFIRIFDMDMRVLYTNPGAAKMTGYDSPAEVPLSKQLYNPEHYSNIYTEGMEMVRKQGFWIGRGELIRADGKLIPIEHTLFKIKNDQGDVILLASIIRDITVFIEHEMTLKDAWLAAEAANVAKSEFLSRMSHEIRTPINAITGMTQIGLNADIIDKKNYCFTVVEKATKQLLNLINDVLDMAKIEADMIEIVNTEFDFKQVISNIVSITSVNAEEKKLDFRVHFGDDVPLRLSCDEMRLSQVITNLLTNAIKFTPKKGSVTLSIDKIEKTEDSITLKFEVADSGIGISKEQQERLFSSFSQADASISQRYGGTGLGLTISKRLVELMGGEIWIESELGQGATFFFTIKAKEAKVKSLPGNDAKIKHRDSFSKRCDFRDKTIIIAEDIEINREIISTILEVTGICVDFAENGKEAVSLFSENPRKYQLILMDINMPEMDGYDATREIRSLNFAEAKNIPIIAMTANVFKEDIEKCIAAGMNDHTGKPVDSDDLFVKLKQHLCPTTS